MAKGAKAEKKVKAGGRGKNRNADPEPEPIPEVEEPAGVDGGAGDEDGRLSPSGPGAVQSAGFTIPVPTTTEGPHDYDAKKDEAEDDDLAELMEKVKIK